MADITKCAGVECPLRHKCYRHTAVTNEFRQSYFTETPYDKVKQECDSFWDNEGRNNEERR